MPELLFSLIGAAIAVASYAAWQRHRVQVVVTTVSDVTIRGDRRCSVLRVVLVNSELLAAGKDPASIGRVEIPRRQVAMVQIPIEQAEDSGS